MTYHAWHVWWLVWFLGSVCAFLAVEVYALCTDWQRTLSAAVWHLEDFQAGQHVSQWTAFHLLFTGLLALLFLWLIFHFSAGWWR